MKGNGENYLFGTGTVVRELQSTTKAEALRELIENAPVFTCINSIHDFENDVLNREKVQSTGFGHGVAVAHGRTSEVDSVKIALGISHRGIEYDSADGEPVHLLFVIANPPDRQMEYLMALSALVKMVRDEMFRREILACALREEIEIKLKSSLECIHTWQTERSHAAGNHSRTLFATDCPV